MWNRLAIKFGFSIDINKVFPKYDSSMDISSLVNAMISIVIGVNLIGAISDSVNSILQPKLTGKQLCVALHHGVYLIYCDKSYGLFDFYLAKRICRKHIGWTYTTHKPYNRFQLFFKHISENIIDYFVRINTIKRSK